MSGRNGSSLPAGATRVLGAFGGALASRAQLDPRPFGERPGAG
jgi:hypothetical protein